MELKEAINELSEIMFIYSDDYMKFQTIREWVEKIDFLKLYYSMDAICMTAFEFGKIVERLHIHKEEDRKRADLCIEIINNYLEGLKIMNML